MLRGSRVQGSLFAVAGFRAWALAFRIRVAGTLEGRVYLMVVFRCCAPYELSIFWGSLPAGLPVRV